MLLGLHDQPYLAETKASTRSFEPCGGFDTF